MFAAAAEHFDAFEPAAFSHMLSGAASLGMELKPSWVESFCDASAPLLAEGFRPPALAQTVWAFALLAAAPDAAWLSALLKAVRGQLPRFNARDLTLTVVGLSMMEVRACWLRGCSKGRRALCGIVGVPRNSCCRNVWKQTKLYFTNIIR